MNTNIREAIVLLGIYRARKQKPETRYLDSIVFSLIDEFDDIPQNDWETIHEAIIDGLLNLESCSTIDLLNLHEKCINTLFDEAMITIPGTEIGIYINKKILKDALISRFEQIRN